MALSALVVLILLFSFDWTKWSNYRKCDKVEYDDGTPEKNYYCKRGSGCHKGYYNQQGPENDGEGTCQKCKDAYVLLSGSNITVKFGDLCDRLIDLVPDENERKSFERGSLDCYCKKGKVKAGSCPAAAEGFDETLREDCSREVNKERNECKDKKYYQTLYKNCKKDKDYEGNEFKGCKKSLKGKRADYHYHGCLYAPNEGRNSYWAVWALASPILFFFWLVNGLGNHSYT